MQNNDLNVITQKESNVRSYVREFPVVFDHAVGSWIFDADNNKYLDFFCSAGSLNYGHNNAVAIQSMQTYLSNSGIINSLDFATTAKIAFIQSFDKYILQPRNMHYKFQFTGPTGTNAVEAAIKLARLATGRSKIIACKNSFHGVTLGSLSVTFSKYYREASGTKLREGVFIPFNNLDKIKTITKEKPAAVILETVQCEGGINIATKEWLKGVEAACKKAGSLLIIDDIQAGCGRTGRFFSFEGHDISPDIIVLSKSLSGSGLPLSLLLVKPSIDIWEPGQHNGTFRGNNLAFTSATSVLKEYWSNYGAMEKIISDKAQLIKNTLEPLLEKSPHILNLRGKGMVYGIEFTDPAFASRLQEQLFKKKLIVERCGKHKQVIKLMPPLTISDDDLLLGLNIIKDTLAEL